MAATLTLVHGPEYGQTTKTFVFGCVFTGNYPAEGPPVDFSPFVSGNVAALPISVTVERLNGYVAAYMPGTSIANGTLKLFTTAATELTAAAFPADVLALTDVRLTVVLPA